MPCRTHLVVAALGVLGLICPAGRLSTAYAQEAQGELRAVDAQGGSIIVKKTTGELSEFRVGSRAKITMNGKAAALDALKPGLKVVNLEVAGDGSIRSIQVEVEPVKLRIAISEEGECRVVVGRSIPEMMAQPAGEMAPISTWYSAKPSPVAGDPKYGSLVGQFADPKRRGGILVCPRAFRLPCLITGDITELRDARLGVQIVSGDTNFILGVTTDDGLRESASLRVTCSSRAPGAEGAYNQKPLTIERPMRLDKPEELRFFLPFTEAQREGLMTLDAVLDAVKREGAAPSATITKVCVVGRDERTLGMVLGVKQGKLVIERVAPSGLAAKAGIKAGDVIVALDGAKPPPLKNAGALTLTFDFALKSRMTLTIMRGGKELAVTIEFD
jgi:hypothetical protein